MRPLLVLALAVCLSPGFEARADADLDALVALVRAEHFEGIPPDAGAALGTLAVRRLIAMLDDADEAPHHHRILEVLGRSGHADVYPALVRYAARRSIGPVDGATYRAQVALPLALGLLARSDDRALAELVARAFGAAEIPQWTYRRLGAGELGGILQRSVETGLALSGRDEARMLLESRAAQSPSPHVEDALRVWSRSRAARDGNR